MVTVRPFDAATDADEAWRLRAVAFGGSRTPEPGWADDEWPAWVASVDGRMCAFARAWPMRQFYGGVAVPMGGLASVTVDQYARGRGVATAMLDTVLPALRESGQPISALYPSVSELYRSRGWEHVGVCEWADVPALALRSLPGSGASSAVELRPAVEADLPAMHECYLRMAAGIDGMLDRGTPPFDMARALTLDVATVVDGPSGLRGYLYASRESSPGLVVYDLVADEPVVAHALLRSVASWAGAVSDVRLRLAEPRSLLPVPFGSAVTADQWMLRVIDLPAAVAARGWPMAAHLRPGLSVDLDVADEHAPWHAGRCRLVVDGGSVTVEPGGSGAVRLTARALAAWYAGSSPVGQLRRAGLLDGDQEAALVLDALTGVGGLNRMANSF